MIDWREQAEWLGRCSFLPASWDKRFARDVQALARAGGDITEKQSENLSRLAYKYRRQMPSQLVPTEKP